MHSLESLGQSTFLKFSSFICSTEVKAFWLLCFVNSDRVPMQMDLPVFLNGFGKEAMDDMFVGSPGS